MKIRLPKGNCSTGGFFVEKMITINHARKIVGKEESSMNDEEVQTLLNDFYELAEIITKLICGSKSVNRGIEMTTKKDDNESN